MVLSRVSVRRVDDCRRQRLRARLRQAALFADDGFRYDHGMPHIAALPFTISRSDDVVGVREITSTREQLHGLLRLEGDDLIIQWRTSRTTDRVGLEIIRTDRELDAVREIVVPLAALASARVRWTWLRWPPGQYLFLTAVDLRAFEEVAGASGLRLKHPAELVVRVAAGVHAAAKEFAGELDLALADRALRAAERLPLDDAGRAPAANRVRLPDFDGTR
jgi:hypothetical protein